MAERMEQLVIHGEEVIIEDDLFINGDLFLKDSSLEVHGNVFIKGHTTILGSDLKCRKLSCNNIEAKDSDISTEFICALNINSDGNIYVAKNAIVGKVKALNYYVGWDNYSNELCIIQDINILGNNSSRTITARDIFIGGNCVMHYFTISAHSLQSGYIYDCSQISIK